MWLFSYMTWVLFMAPLVVKVQVLLPILITGGAVVLALTLIKRKENLDEQ